MQSNLKKLKNIPTNLISGFLGVGKTSSILHLMEQKPADEKWSVLVNEFGSVGIDGAIYKANGIKVKEIPGGCMCCAAGVPLQVAVNQILKATRPQRLLIEPSGLGHPKRVLDTLQGEYFKEVLSLKARFCLVDPRNLLDERYTTHENFIDQIALADILVANKSDLCDDKVMANFDDFAKALQPQKQQIIKTQFGHLDAALLDLDSSTLREAQFPSFHEHGVTKPSQSETPTDGYYNQGWQFSNKNIFDYDKVTHFFNQFDNVRIKAILQTNQGWMVFNIKDEQKEIYAIESSADNRLEIIGRDIEVMDKEKLDEEINRCID